MEDIIVPIVFFLTVGLAWYFYLQARTKERLACIEKGLDVMPRPRKPGDSRKIVFTIGLFLVGLSLGFLSGYFLDKAAGHNPISYFITLLFFGGLSLVISIFIKFKKVE